MPHRYICVYSIKIHTPHTNRPIEIHEHILHRCVMLPPDAHTSHIHTNKTQTHTYTGPQIYTNTYKHTTQIHAHIHTPQMYTTHI
jgi:hypothetical protein